MSGLLEKVMKEAVLSLQSVLLAIFLLSLAIVSLVFAETLMLVMRLFGCPAPDQQEKADKKKKTRVAIICDAGNVCGVNTKYNELTAELRGMDFSVLAISPNDYIGNRVRLPGQEDVMIPIPWPWLVYDVLFKIEYHNPEIINIMAEGTLGFMTMVHCILRRRKYSTMFCTRLDTYIGEMTSHVLGWVVKQGLKIFHLNSSIVITPGKTFGKLLVDGGYVTQQQLRVIPNGCNTEKFTGGGPIDTTVANLPRPIWLYVGRVSHEKNVDAFLKLHDKLEGSMVVVGAGNYLEEARQIYAGAKNIHFLGWRTGEALYSVYRGADVFVFPSLTDTFGQVMVEAMASGLTVAAYPVTGPLDVVKPNENGCFDDDLLQACKGAQKIAKRPGIRDICRNYAVTFSWKSMAKSFVKEHDIEHQHTA